MLNEKREMVTKREMSYDMSSDTNKFYDQTYLVNLLITIGLMTMMTDQYHKLESKLMTNNELLLDS